SPLSFCEIAGRAGSHLSVVMAGLDPAIRHAAAGAGRRIRHIRRRWRVRDIAGPRVKPEDDEGTDWAPARKAAWQAQPPLPSPRPAPITHASNPDRPAKRHAVAVF